MHASLPFSSPQGELNRVGFGAATSTVRSSLVVDGHESGSKFLACCGSFAVLVRRAGVCCVANNDNNGTWEGETSGERARCQLRTSTESTASW